jgi:hypothetical protein
MRTRHIPPGREGLWRRQAEANAEIERLDAACDAAERKARGGAAVTAPDVDEVPVVAAPTLCGCGRPNGPVTWQITRTTRRTFTHAELHAMDARIARAERWQRLFRWRPAGWRSR